MNIGWPNLPGALLLVLAGLLILAGLIGLAVWDARRRRSPAITVDVAGAIARVWVAFTGLGIILALWRWFTPGDVWVSGVPATVRVPGLTCEGVEGPVFPAGPTLVCGNLESADLTVAGVGLDIRALLAGGDVLTLIAVAVPGVVLALACSRALKGTPFSVAVRRALVIGAIVVLVAGLGGELLASMGRTILSNELFSESGDMTSTGVYRVGVSLWPIAAAFALAALGGIFRHGERLQRETTGLV
jgi:hypothetical protein